MSIVFPIDKPVEKRSQKPLKRILIQEINVDVDKQLEEARNEISSKIKLNENDEKLFSLNNKTLISEITNEPKVVNEEAIVKEEKKIVVTEKKAEKPKSVAKVIIPPAPTNGFQFRKDWQMLSNNLDDLAVYFKQIPPETYTKLFMNGLESDMLSKIFMIFKKLYLL